eukprot:Clim_evm10s199 gene=Clim_evmTU10s199
MVPPPPPPPAPPPPVPKSHAQAPRLGGQYATEFKGCDQPCHCMEHQREAARNLARNCRDNWPETEEIEKVTGAYYINPSHTVRQAGATCGPVAAVMGLSSAVPDQVQPRDLVALSERLLRVAKSAKVSVRGEFFNAENLCKVLQQIVQESEGVSGVQVGVVDVSDGEQSIALVLDTLQVGGVVLVPYDADANGEPCQHGGKRAHWAVITGFAAALPLSEEVVGDADQHVLNLADVNDDLTCAKVRDGILKEHVNHARFAQEAGNDEARSCLCRYICLQGKSRHPSAWSVESLVASSRQLTSCTWQPNPDDDPETYQTTDLSSTLAGQWCVIVRK